ncbi:MAG: THUMP domain-containing class I SAM-dependent RNA methyltransferase [Flavobacteriaceae bacterium]|nr:class I SAM-dependent RNA methyltransferase [Flavobacteriaceae bacterium]
MNQDTSFLAKTFYGFEPLLEKELRKLGAKNIKSINRAVSFEGDLGFLYKANLSLRTALRILMPIGFFPVKNQTDLYRAIGRIDWSKWFSADQSFIIDVTLFSDHFNHSLFVAQKAKDAIVDQFSKKEGKRPSVTTENPDIRIQLHLQGDQLTISLDSSGNSLHQRGYRIETNIAPINEVLAAGILLHSGWEGKTYFYDPMCGSGTLAIEAAMIACNIPPSLNRATFSFMNWKNFDAELFEVIRNSSLSKVREFRGHIYASDKAPSAVRKAQENIEKAGLEEYISVVRSDFFFADRPSDVPLHVVFNPPYGERLSIDADVFYGKIGDTLKKEYQGCEAWFITANIEALKSVGLRPSRKIKMFNGKLESRLVNYELYEGSRKASKA